MNSFKLSKGSLAIVLSSLRGFQSPKVREEQYATDSEIAADILWKAYLRGDIEGKVIVDLGCGTGLLGIGALLLGAREAVFVDNDKEALEIAKSNLQKAKSESSRQLGKATFLYKDIEGVVLGGDVVLQNPPFGTKVRHMDRMFLTAAMKIAPIIYSLHKSETLGFVRAFCRDGGYKITNTDEYSFPLKRTMAFHRKRVKSINVTCFRMKSEG